MEQIAGAFLVAPAAMEQQITRAKRTIAKVGVEFDTPDRQDENLFPSHCRQGDLSGVLEAESTAIGGCPLKVMVFAKATKDIEDEVPPDPKALELMHNYNEALIAAGILKDQILGGLKPTRFAKRVQFSGKNCTVIDGPFAETKELVAGFSLWEVKSIEEAVEWAKKCPMPTDCEVDIRLLYSPETWDPV